MKSTSPKRRVVMYYYACFSIQWAVEQSQGVAALRWVCQSIPLISQQQVSAWHWTRFGRYLLFYNKFCVRHFWLRVHTSNWKDHFRSGTDMLSAGMYVLHIYMLVLDFGGVRELTRNGTFTRMLLLLNRQGLRLFTRSKCTRPNHEAGWHKVVCKDYLKWILWKTTPLQGFQTWRMCSLFKFKPRSLDPACSVKKRNSVDWV